VQIRKSTDQRINEVAELIEHLQDYKYHIKPYEIAEEVVKLLDNLAGIAYANKIKKDSKDRQNFEGKNNGTS
jgi:hypothetical protein